MSSSPMERRVRAVAVARGDPRHPLTASGVTKPLLDALDRRCDVVGTVDCSLRPWQRAATMAASVHPDRAVWRERFYRHPLAWRFQSRNASSGLPDLTSFDVAVQVFALFQTSGAPVVYDLDTTHEVSRRRWPAWSPMDKAEVARWYARERRAYNAAAHLFVRTREVRDSLTGFYGVDPARVTVAGGGVSFDPLPEPRPADAREAVILFVGREWERKGGDLLLAAFERLRSSRPDAVLRVVGTTEAPSRPGIEVLGRVDSRERVQNLYATASVFCLPARYDPYPGAVMEAMAFATPVVVSDTGGLSDIVDEGRAGVVVDPEDAEGMAAQLERFLSDPAARAEVGAAGRARVEAELTWDRVVDRWLPVLEEIAARRPRGQVN